ncbi:hypothetical protein KY290_007869 [Solanum tuberosum]|uniref:Integrase catalytic domain-containing protein n=1 Tax=Solanum tuberosum TaxID=4113 RepID=A0ABQ7W8P3_SOLTU|nr:hypothetical protein KY290_007869 [Solanum tuberosum]
MLSKKCARGKDEASNLQLGLETSLNTAEMKLVMALERNDQLERDLVCVKEELNKSLKWTTSSKLLVNLTSQGQNYGKGSGGSSSQCWFMDSQCLKNMNGKIENFLSLKALQDGCVSFENGKKGYILGVEKIGKSLEHSIENVYYVNGLKYSLLSVSQICDKCNEVRFLSEMCIVTNLTSKKVILTAKRCKNMYVADLDTAQGDDLTSLSAQSENTDLLHKRHVHVSSSMLNKLVSRDLFRGLPTLRFSDDKVCDACVKGNQIRSSFESKKQVSTTRSLELIHMDMCGPVKIQSRGGKKYILVIVDDYSRYTWTMFLRSKDETYDVLMIFVKMIQTKLNCKIAGIRSDHGTEFQNAKLDNFCAEIVFTITFQLQEHLSRMVLLKERIELWLILPLLCSLIQIFQINMG